ncbi:MAG: thiamine phosphate synthase [Dehalococcoidia bacterium]
MTTPARSGAPPDRMRRWPNPALMLITDRARLRGRRLEEVVSAAIDGGVNAVQLREKDLPTTELYDLTITLRAVVRGRALLLVNDRVDVALSAGADGVHLPERSLPGEKVRGLVGEHVIVGRSVHSVEAAQRAASDGVDYVQVGAVYETASKPGVVPAGVELVRAVADVVSVRVIAVGGITAEAVGEVIEAGVDGVAVIGAILDADDPRLAASKLWHALDEAYG